MQSLRKRPSAASARKGLRRDTRFADNKERQRGRAARAHLKALALDYQPAADSAVAVADARCQRRQLISSDLRTNGVSVSLRFTHMPFVPSMAHRGSQQTRRARSGLTGKVLCSTWPVLSKTSTREQTASLCCAPAAMLPIVSLPVSPAMCACLLGSAASMPGERRQCISAGHPSQANTRTRNSVNLAPISRPQSCLVLGPLLLCQQVGN